MSFLRLPPNFIGLFSYLGDRTFGVLTKLDLMDKGTNALDVSILPALWFFRIQTFSSRMDFVLWMVTKLLSLSLMVPMVLYC